MSASESDRDDLMREAVALTERVELQVPGVSNPVTIGFRANHAMSVFVGQDPVYQFDGSGRLRRAFVDGFLFRSQHETLARLQRVRTTTEVQLLRHDLPPTELLSFHAQLLNTLLPVALSVKDRTVTVIRRAPEAVDLLPRIDSALLAVLTTDVWLSSEIRRRAL